MIRTNNYLLHLTSNDDPEVLKHVCGMMIRDDDKGFIFKPHEINKRKDTYVLSFKRDETEVDFPILSHYTEDASMVVLFKPGAPDFSYTVYYDNNEITKELKTRELVLMVEDYDRESFNMAFEELEDICSIVCNCDLPPDRLRGQLKAVDGPEVLGSLFDDVFGGLFRKTEYTPNRPLPDEWNWMIVSDKMKSLTTLMDVVVPFMEGAGFANLRTTLDILDIDIDLHLYKFLLLCVQNNPKSGLRYNVFSDRDIRWIIRKDKESGLITEITPEDLPAFASKLAGALLDNFTLALREVSIAEMTSGLDAVEVPLISAQVAKLGMVHDM
jgi:hypothetical protein